MKQCISRIINLIIHLWQTLKEYVCRRVKVKDVTGDGHKDVIITNDLEWDDRCHASQSSQESTSELEFKEENHDK